MLRKFLVLAFVALFAGCGVKAQTYVMTKPRVGIENKGGNVGYLAGQGKYQEPEKKTRKVYVLEVSKPAPEGSAKKGVPAVQAAVAQPPQAQEEGTEPSAHQGIESARRKIVIPPIEDVPFAEEGSPAAAASGPTEAVSYTVQKDDTLQKVAKKFYNSYGKWVKIYDANKAKIKNPNILRPGTVLTIPAK